MMITATLATTLPTIPAPSVRGQGLLLLASILVGVPLSAILGAKALKASRTRNRVIGGVLASLPAVAALAMCFGMYRWEVSVRDAHQAEVRDAIEAHWDVSHIDGRSTGTWAGEVDGDVVQCVTYNNDRLAVVCDGVAPPTRR